MTHPEEQLAAYVDGALPGHERAEVERHLAGCARCRDEVALARAASQAMRGLEELPAPAGVASEALREAAAATSKPPWYVKLVPVAAAAALVAVIVAVALPKIGNNAQPAAAPERAATSAAGVTHPHYVSPSATAPLVISTTDYGPTQVQGLAQAGADRLSGRALAPSAADAASVTLGSESEAQSARTCLLKTIPLEPEEQLLRLVQATFEHTPVYIGVFAEGPGAAQPPDRVVVFVVRRDGCTIVSYSAVRLTS